jgi:hypothetical protein
LVKRSNTEEGGRREGDMIPRATVNEGVWFQSDVS